MKLLKILGGIVIVLALVFFLGGLLLPKTYSISRTTVINAPDSTVFNNVADFNNFLKWNPWTKMEPSAKVVITGTPSQTGHLWQWAGKETGKGQMEIVGVQPNSEINYKLTFTEPMQSVANCNFNFKPVDEGTQVTWSMNGEATNMMERWFFLNMDNMMDKDFTNGLGNLKQLSETK